MREQEIRLVHEAGVWVAIDVDTGVSAHGGTRDEALTSLDAALEADDGTVSEPDDLVREMGIDPDELHDEDGEV